MIGFDYIRPATVQAAIAALNKDASAQLIAGGTNLVDLMKKGVSAPQKLVDISRLPLNTITQKGNIISIGALALNSAVAAHPLIKEKFPLLSQALDAGASQQIRNMATVGGNLLQRTRCSYFYDITMPCNKRQPGSGCSALQGYNRMHAIFGASDSCIAVHPSDMCVALAALDATVVITHAKGERRVAFTDFHRLPGNTPEKDNNLAKGEIITAIEIPINTWAAKSKYSKVRDRQSYAFALVSVAIAADMKDDVINNIRIAMGGVAHKPWRLLEAEKMLKGKKASTETIAKAVELEMKSARSYGHNNFKIALAAALLRSNLAEVCGAKS